MTAPLLGLDSPAIRPSFFGGWLVDDGGIVPVRAATWRVAREEAAARSKNSGSTPPPSPGTVPGSVAAASPDPYGSGTTFSSSQPHGAAGGEGCAGVTEVEAAVTPANGVHGT